MTTKEILAGLCAHELSKEEAEGMIEAKLDALRRKGDFEFKVEKTSFTVENGDFIMSLRMPYGHSKVKNLIRIGDKVDVTPIR